jgi:hypothetical protein
MSAPVPPRRDPLIWPMLQRFRTSIAAQLILAERPVCKFPLHWGADRPPADLCDCTCADGGQGVGWGRWVQSGPAPDVGPRTAAVPTECSAGKWMVTLEFGVYRCYPVLDDAGNPPAELAIDRATQGFHDDAAALRRGVRCNQWLEEKDLTWQFVTQIPLTPAGGCAGVATQFRIHQAECKC